MNDSPTPLVEAIESLRTDLAKLANSVSQEGIRFPLDEVVVKLDLLLEKEASLDGGLRWLVVSANAKGSISSSRSHSLTLKMRAVEGPRGRSVEIGSSNFDSP